METPAPVQTATPGAEPQLLPPAPDSDALIPSPPTSPFLTDGLRKISVLLITLGEQASAQIIRSMSESEVQKISKAIGMAESVNSKDALAVVREFHQLALARTFVVKGGMDYASRMLQAAFGPDSARRLLDQVSESIRTENANFDALQKAEPQQLANFIHGEHPQTIALILSHLNSTQAAALLISMPPHLRADLARRMASLDQISPEIISKIAHVVGDKLRSLGDLSRESYGGIRAVADMFNRMHAHVRKEILNELAEQDQPLAEDIRQLMFVFEDLLMVDGRGIREILVAIDPKRLAVALKGTSEKLHLHIMHNMSQVGALALREDLETLGPIRVKDVEDAQQEIIALARELESKGFLSLTASPQDSYVV